MTPRHLILIRHSNVEIVPDNPAATWLLSDEGRARAAMLVQPLRSYRPDRVFASAEPKAAETGEIIAAGLHILFATAPDLHEHERSRVPFRDREQFEAQVQEFFAAPTHLIFGDETADQAHHRFTSAMQNLLNGYPSQSLAVVTHGTVLTLYVSRLTGLEPFQFWQQLGLPAFVVLSLPELRLLRIENKIEKL